MTKMAKMADWQECLNHIDEKQDIYIYGAGVIAFYLARNIIQGGWTVKAFVVRDTAKNVGEYFDIPVISIDDVHPAVDKAVIFVGVYVDKQQGIDALLRIAGFTQAYFLTKEDCFSLRRTFLDLDGEMFRDIRCIKQYGGMLDKIYHEDTSEVYRGYAFDSKRYGTDFALLAVDEDMLEQKVEALTAGMDARSVKEIYRIVSRLYALRDKNPILYDEDEKKAVQEIQNIYAPNIYKISGKHWACSVGDRVYSLPINHFESCVFYDACGLPTLGEDFSLAGKNVLDVGAFVGDSALVFIKNYRAEKVYAFEPSQHNCQLMRQTISMNRLTNLEPVRVALSDYCGKEKLYMGDGNSATNTLKPDHLYTSENSKVEQVPVTTLDAFCEEHALENIGLIKVDIEGAEQAFLRGAIKNIQRWRPVLAVSIYHNLDDFFSIKPWLEARLPDYQFHIARPVSPDTLLTETMLMAVPIRRVMDEL